MYSDLPQQAKNGISQFCSNEMDLKLLEFAEATFGEQPVRDVIVAELVRVLTTPVTWVQS